MRTNDPENHASPEPALPEIVEPLAEIVEPLAEIVEERRRSLGVHPDLRRLRALRAGELPPEDAEAMREHLSLCGDCLDLLLLDPDSRADETDAGALDFETHRAWREMRARTREHELRLQLARRTRSLRFLQAAAALLVLVPGLLWLQARDSSTRFEPVANAAIFDVKQSQIRGLDHDLPGPTAPAPGPSPENVTPITVPAASEAFTLVFWLDSRGFEGRAFENYEIVVRDHGGGEIWRSRDLTVDLGTATLGLSRRFMPAGRYRVEIFGAENDGRALLGEYSISLSYS